MVCNLWSGGESSIAASSLLQHQMAYHPQDIGVNNGWIRPKIRFRGASERSFSFSTSFAIDLLRGILPFGIYADIILNSIKLLWYMCLGDGMLPGGNNKVSVARAKCIYAVRLVWWIAFWRYPWWNDVLKYPNPVLLFEQRRVSCTCACPWLWAGDMTKSIEISGGWDE